MKSWWISLLAVGAWMNTQAQIKNPVKWEFSALKKDATTYELIATAFIDAGWHIYTTDHKSDIGVATKVNFGKHPLVTPASKMRIVGKIVSLKDPSTGELVRFYENKVSFVQPVKLKSPVKTQVSGSVEYMTCDDRQCLPPASKTFSLSLE